MRCTTMGAARLHNLAVYCMLVAAVCRASTEASNNGTTSSVVPKLSATSSSSAAATCQLSITARQFTAYCTGRQGSVRMAPVRSTRFLVSTHGILKDDPQCDLELHSTSAIFKICSDAGILAISDSNIKGINVPAPTAFQPPASLESERHTLLFLNTDKGSITIENSTFSSIFGATAVSIRAGKLVEVEKCTFQNIHAGRNTFAAGALAVFMHQPLTAVQLRGNMFDNCSAEVAGGVDTQVRQQQHTTVKVTDSNTFKQCAATRLSAGGLFVNASRASAASVELSGATFEGNSAVTRGGGCNLLLSGSTASNIHMHDVILNRNSAAEGAGGGCSLNLNSSVSSEAVITGKTTFTNNTSIGPGGGLAVQALNSSDCAVMIHRKARFEKNMCRSPGEFVEVFLREPAFGGGLYIISSQSANMSTVIADEVAFNANSAPTGGGMYIQYENVSNSRVQLLGNVQVSSNQAFATTGGGAAIEFLFSKNSNLTASGTLLFQDNTAADAGGGLSVGMSYVQSALVEISDGAAFIRNRAVSESGGGCDLNLYEASRSAALVRNNVTFMHNQAAGRGAGGCAITLDNANTTLAQVQSVSFINNTGGAGQGGGLGVQLQNSTDCNATIVETLSRENKAGSGGGQAVNCVNATRSTISMSNNTLVSNNATRGGGLLLMLDGAKESTATINASQFLFNSAVNGSAGGSYVDFSTSAGTRFAVNKAVNILQPN